LETRRVWSEEISKSVVRALGRSGAVYVRKGVCKIHETDRGLLFLANHNNIIYFQEENSEY
jgi:hypothetical protein